MNIVMMMVLTITMMLMMMTLMIMTLSKKMIKDMQKSSPFECGFNPMSYPRIPFSIHFFLIAVIFLIFDIEIILIMPMIMTIKSSTITTWLITSISFVLILLMGLFHEWKNGMMEWTS